MKRRAMKKWIPEGTCYCYGHRRTGKCKWLRLNKKVDYQESGYCMYLKLGDWFKNGTMLLWDECKECGVIKTKLVIGRKNLEKGNGKSHLRTNIVKYKGHIK